MGPFELPALAAWLAASVALIALGGGAIYRVGKLTQNLEDLRRELHAETSHINQVTGLRFDELQALIRSENAQTRAQIQQLSNALMSHSHDVDGNITFRVPPPAQEE